MFEKILQNKAGCAFTNALVWEGMKEILGMFSLGDRRKGLFCFKMLYSIHP